MLTQDLGKILFAAALLGGCGDASDSSFEPSLLACPDPGELPFATESTEFVSSEARAIAESKPRNKDDASDRLGVADGLSAYTHQPIDSPSSSEGRVYQGRRARTELDAGGQADGLAGEWISLWTWDGAAWNQLARTQTDQTGEYFLTGFGASRDRFQPVYAILEADGSCAAHYDFLAPAATQLIVSDIDGTLTLDDAEFIMQIGDGNHDPAEMGSAPQLIDAWSQKGYLVVYLTARGHTFRSETRTWLDAHGFPPGPLITAEGLALGSAAEAYKATWIKRIQDDFGWEIVAAYGNAETDIGAYADAGVAKELTFIVGELAGTEDTQAIDDLDYAAHIAEYVATTPEADQPF